MRFTVRRMMAVVAVVGLVVGGTVEVRRIIWHRFICESMIGHHEAWEREQEEVVDLKREGEEWLRQMAVNARLERAFETADGLDDLAKILHDASVLAKKRAETHADMKRKWQRAKSRFWEPWPKDDSLVPPR
jgi:hypothetical protein